MVAGPRRIPPLREPLEPSAWYGWRDHGVGVHSLFEQELPYQERSVVVSDHDGDNGRLAVERVESERSELASHIVANLVDALDALRFFDYDV